MSTVRRGYIDGDYGQIHVRKCKARAASGKPPLFCLHQSPKSSGEFEAFLTSASGERDVIAADYPGYGLSDAPPSEGDASIKMYARAMWQMADAFGLGPIDLFGNHTGGMVAVEMAQQRPADVHAIAMISASVLTEEECDAFRKIFVPIPLDEAGTRFEKMWQSIRTHRGPGMTLDMMAGSLAMNLMGGEAYEWGHVAAFDYSAAFETAIQTLPHRLTILNPADMLQEITRRAETLVRNGEVIECPDWGIGFVLAFPEEAAALVLSKLDASVAVSA